jgi:porin
MQTAKLCGGIARRVILAMVCTVQLQNLASGASDPPSDDSFASSAPNQTGRSLPQVLRQLTDVGGLRSRLEQAGLRFTFTYYGDAFGNPLGGVTQGLGYDGRFGTIIDGDLEKLAGWSGASFHASIHQIQGTQFSATNLQSLAVASSVEALPSTRLFNLWIEQKIGDDMNLRFGQFSASQEFLVSQTAALFVNSTFGWPVLPADDLPSGGPSYPEATPAARVTWTPTQQFSVRAAIFDGDPAGPGTGNPVLRDPYGLAFRVNDPPLLIAELDYAYNQDKSALRDNPQQEGAGGPPSLNLAPGAPSATTGLPGAVKIGAWFHTGQFADLRLNAQGELLAASGGPPLEHSGNFAVYGIIDQTLFRAPAPSGRQLDFFLRAATAPDDRNLVDFYLDSGLTYKGLLTSRPDDNVGLGVAYSRISPQAAAYDRDIAAITGAAMPIRDYEALIELTYNIRLATNWSAQPDLQYIIHPGGSLPNPRNPDGTTAIPNALVVGLRTVLKF